MHTSLLLALWVSLSFFLYKLVSVALTEYTHRKREYTSGCQRPPPIQRADPLGIDTVRNLLKADKECRFPIHLKERAEAASNGKSLHTFYQTILGSPSIFTSDPKNIQAVLATEFKDFGLGDGRNNNFYPLLGRAIFSTDGKQWEHSRALLRPQFAREQVSDLELEENHVQNMMRCITSNSDGWTDVMDLKKLFFRLTIDAGTEFLFGESVNSQLSSLPGFTSNKLPNNVGEFAYSFDEAKAQIAKGARFGDYYWLAHNKEFKEHCRQCHIFIDYYVQLALSKPSPGSTQSSSPRKKKYVFLEALAESTRDPVELRSQLLSMLFAGRDNTASLPSFLFMVFEQHPHVFKKLREIIITEFGTYESPKDITFSNLKGCSYLQWCLNETLRLYPTVPVDVRRALKDTRLPVGGGPDGTSPIYVRKGMQIDYSVYVMHRRKDLWGPDADLFKPERWNGRRSGWEYLPFNGGPRICIGQEFSLTEAGYVTVRLLQRFDKLQGVGNSWESPDKGGYGYVRQWVTLTGSPADGVKVKLREAKKVQ